MGIGCRARISQPLLLSRSKKKYVFRDMQCKKYYALARVPKFIYGVPYTLFIPVFWFNIDRRTCDDKLRLHLEVVVPCHCLQQRRPPNDHRTLSDFLRYIPSKQEHR